VPAPAAPPERVRILAGSFAGSVGTVVKQEGGLVTVALPGDPGVHVTVARVEPVPAFAFNINGNGFKGGRVPAVEAGLVGVWRDGKPWTPDRAAVRALLPAAWRAAFDRSGAFWFDKSDPTRPAYLHLRDTRGRRRTTIYANATDA
jgi:hypothetical protein